jgi:hypothetical protein
MTALGVFTGGFSFDSTSGAAATWVKVWIDDDGRLPSGELKVTRTT